MAKQSRFLTYLFCDLVGSTELTRDHEPEDAFELIVGFQDACRQQIERFKGYVACYMGDGVVGYFGYPVSIDPAACSVVDGKLYLNYSLGVRESWNKDIPGYIQRADGNWPEVLKR